MEITVETIEEALKDKNCNYDAYTVRVENQRILTVITGCDLTVAKWLKEASKTTNSPKSNSLLVGVSYDCQQPFPTPTPPRKPNHCHYVYGPHPYELLELSIGSHCLLYYLPDSSSHRVCKALDDFFSQPKVVAVGMGMKSLASKLEEEYDMKFGKIVDLTNCPKLMAKMMGGAVVHPRLLKFTDLDELAKVVLGKRMYVVRAEKKVEWFAHTSYCYGYEYPQMSHEMVKYATVDAYLCYLIGQKLLDGKGGGDDHDPTAVAASLWENKKKKSTNKKKNFSKGKVNKMKFKEKVFVDDYWGDDQSF